MPGPALKRRRRRRRILIVAALIVAALGSAGAMIARRRNHTPAREAETCAVKRGVLSIIVSEGGALQAERMQRICSEVRADVKILSIVPEGTTITDEDVKKGKVLVTLDSAQLKDRASKESIEVEAASEELTRAKEDLQIQEKQNESNIRKANLDVELAQADLFSYLGKELANSLDDKTNFAELHKSEKLGGVALQKKTELENSVRMADEQVKRAKDKVTWTDRLYQKKYVTGDELRADQLAMMQQEAQHRQAQLALDLFLTYDMPKEAKTRSYACREKQLELERVRARANSERAQAQARLKSRESSFNTRTKGLEELNKQVEACTIKADKPGLVVYASSSNPWQRSGVIEVGASVRERQEIINLPDLSSLIAKVKIHESAVKKVAPGQPATITVDAYPGLIMHGKVKEVAPLPDPQWLLDTKLFTTTITIEGDNSNLKPGISCRAEIAVATLPDVLFVPIQTVTVRGHKQYCVLADDRSQSPREVTTGESDDKFVEIKSGLKEGERVLLRPGILPPEEEVPGDEVKPAEKKPEVQPAAGESKAAGATPAAKTEPAKGHDDSASKKAPTVPAESKAADAGAAEKTEPAKAPDDSATKKDQSGKSDEEKPAAPPSGKNP